MGFLTADEVCRAGVPTDGRDGAPGCWRTCVAAEPQSLRHGCRARGGPGRQHPNPSIVGVELEEAQGGAGALGPRELGGPGPERRPLGACSNSSAGQRGTRPALWIPPMCVGRGRGSAGNMARASASASVGALRWVARKHSQLECLLRLFGDRNRRRACESWRLDDGERRRDRGEGAQDLAGRRWGSR